MSDLYRYWNMVEQIKEIIRLNKEYGVPKKSDDLWENIEFFDAVASMKVCGIVPDEYDKIEYIEKISNIFYNGKVAGSRYRECLTSTMEYAQKRLDELREKRKNESKKGP